MSRPRRPPRLGILRRRSMGLLLVLGLLVLVAIIAIAAASRSGGTTVVKD